MLFFECGFCATKGARSYQEDMASYWDATPRDVGAAGAVRAATPVEGALQEAMSSAPPDMTHVVTVLADGMGGHAGGSVASDLVCRHFIEAYAADTEAPTVESRLVDALAHCNAAIAHRIDEDPVLSGMGSTLIGAVFGPEGVTWISVGDSPLLLFRRGEVALLNEDHSLAPELDRLASVGRLTPEQARSDPRRHMLRSAVCGEEIELIDIAHTPVGLAPGDYVILASDGLQALDASETARIISAYAGDGAQAVAEALIREVENLRDPHQDNATVVVVRPRLA